MSEELKAKEDNDSGVELTPSVSSSAVSQLNWWNPIGWSPIVKAAIIAGLLSLPFWQFAKAEPSSVEGAIEDVPRAASKTSFNSLGDKQHYTFELNNMSVHGQNTDRWEDVVDAKIGDQIAFSIGYHNSGKADAYNTRLRVSQGICTETASCRRVCGHIRADNVDDEVFKCAKILVADAASSEFYALPSYHVVWRPARTQWGEQRLIGQQTGAEVFGAEGVFIGRVGVGWTHHGSLIGSFAIVGQKPNIKNINRPSETADDHY